MNLIQRWCMARCGIDSECSKCTAECVPRLRLSEGTGVSEHLLWILQNQVGGVTHPKIADIIADYIGASSEERDEIVHKKHYGTYTPMQSTPVVKQSGVLKPNASNAFTVVAIDCIGNEFARFGSAKDAGDRYGVTSKTVVARCNRVAITKSEFEPLGVSFRFLEEWEGMSESERRADINSVRERMLIRGGSK